MLSFLFVKPTPGFPHLEFIQIPQVFNLLLVFLKGQQVCSIECILPDRKLSAQIKLKLLLLPMYDITTIYCTKSRCDQLGVLESKELWVISLCVP